MLLPRGWDLGLLVFGLCAQHQMNSQCMWPVIQFARPKPIACVHQLLVTRRVNGPPDADTTLNDVQKYMSASVYHSRIILTFRQCHVPPLYRKVYTDLRTTWAWACELSMGALQSVWPCCRRKEAAPRHAMERRRTEPIKSHAAGSTWSQPAGVCHKG